MKKLLYGLLGAAAMFTACESEETALSTGGKVINVEIEGSLDTNPLTKVGYSPNNDKSTFAFSWHEGDAISLFVPGTTGNDNQQFLAKTAAKSSPFNGKLTTWSGEKTAYAVYPYSATGYTLDNSNITVNQTSSAQTVDAGNTNRYANGLMIAASPKATAASASTYNIPKLNFKQAMAFLYLELSNIPSGESVVGMGVEAATDIFNASATIKLADGTITGTPTKAKKLTATVSNHSGTTATLPFALLPADLSGKAFDITVTTKKGSERKTYKRTISNGANFERNKFSYTNALDLQADFTLEGTGGTLMLADFNGTFVPTGDTWVIEDETAIAADFVNLKNTLDNKVGGRKISLEFPKLKAVPNQALSGEGYSNRTLSSVSCPVATTIGDNAFRYCKALETVSFPVTTTIGENAFRYCDALTTVSFPVVTTIGGYAFGYCDVLATVSFPEVTTIGSCAFEDCDALTAVDFPMATNIGSSAFGGCIALETVSFPMVTTIGGDAFSSCIQLKEASFPALTSMGSEAFYGCDALTTLTIATNANTEIAGMGSGVFNLTETTSHEGNVTFNIGAANASKVSGYTLTVKRMDSQSETISYTFKKINLVGGGDSDADGEGEDGTGEKL